MHVDLMSWVPPVSLCDDLFGAISESTGAC